MKQRSLPGLAAAVLALCALAAASPSGCAGDEGPRVEVCGGGHDEDADGLTDCGDADCWIAGGACAQVCGSGEDQDADGLTDCDDADCWVAGGACAQVCGSGEDQDADGRTDCDDADCWLAGGLCQEACTGGHDEDGDGLADCDDTDCEADVACVPTFHEDAQPVFLRYCSLCHAEGMVFGALDFDDYATTQQPSYYCPGKTKGECALVRILEPSMPQNCLGCVADADRDLIAAWIGGGMLP